MRELLHQNHTQSTPHSSVHISPHGIHDQQQVRQESSSASPASQFTHPQPLGPLTVPNSNTYANQQYKESVNAVSPNGVSVPSLRDAIVAENDRVNKRKRSCFEIRDESIADFINEGLITLECAMSCFNT